MSLNFAIVIKKKQLIFTLVSQEIFINNKTINLLRYENTMPMALQIFQTDGIIVKTIGNS